MADLVLRRREGLAQLLALLQARAEALSNPPPLPASIADDFAEWFNPDEPATGFFRMRLVRGGPYVPMVIFRDSGEHWGWVDDELWRITNRLIYPDGIHESRFLRMHQERAEAERAGDRRHWRLRTRTPIDMTEI